MCVAYSGQSNVKLSLSFSSTDTVPRRAVIISCSQTRVMVWYKGWGTFLLSPIDLTSLSVTFAPFCISRQHYSFFYIYVSLHIAKIPHVLSLTNHFLVLVTCSDHLLVTPFKIVIRNILNCLLLSVRLLFFKPATLYLILKLWCYSRVVSLASS